MSVSFLTPESGALALGAILPLVLLIEGERRAQLVRAILRLPSPPSASRGVLVASLIAVPALLGLAAMQPVIDREVEHVTRTDAEAFFIVDTSRSMLAAPRSNAPTRFHRARAAALQVRADLADVPSGIASLTDRLLPHLFPSADADTFAATLERSVGVNRPPPVDFHTRATTLGSLAALPTQNYFTPEVRHRLAIVFTDAESRPFAAENLGELFRRAPRVALIFVRVGDLDERVYTADGEIEPAYRPDPNAEQTVQALASASGGSAFDEDELGAVVRAARRAIGEGKTEVRGDERTKIALAPYSVALAVLPLGLVLWRRNL